MRFGFGSHILQSATKTELNKVAAYMKQNPDVRIRITGHGSLDVPNVYEVSLNRARSGKSYLVSQGIAGSRIETKSKGVQDLIAEMGNPSNQRIEVTPIN